MQAEQTEEETQPSQIKEKSSGRGGAARCQGQYPRLRNIGGIGVQARSAFLALHRLLEE